MYTISQIGVLLLLLFLYPSYLYETYDGIDPNDDDVEDDGFYVCGLYQHLQDFFVIHMFWAIVVITFQNMLSIVLAFLLMRKDTWFNRFYLNKFTIWYMNEI